MTSFRADVVVVRRSPGSMLVGVLVNTSLGTCGVDARDPHTEWNSPPGAQPTLLQGVVSASG